MNGIRLYLAKWLIASISNKKFLKMLYGATWYEIYKASSLQESIASWKP